MEDKKNILLAIHNIDSAAFKFNNKFKFMNLQLLVGSLDSLQAEQLHVIAEKIQVLEKLVTELSESLNNLDEPTLDLIKSYDKSNFND